jgi:hypothetical protein
MNKFQTNTADLGVKKFDYKALVAECKSLGLDTKGKAFELDARIDAYYIANPPAEVVSDKVEKRGRKINPDSPRQKRLAMQALGSGQRGRRPDPNSTWNIKQAALKAKREEGTLKLGRAINPESARQQRLAKVGTVKRGRPAQVKDEVVTPIEAAVDAQTEAIIDNMFGGTEV